MGWRRARASRHEQLIELSPSVAVARGPWVEGRATRVFGVGGKLGPRAWVEDLAVSLTTHLEQCRNTADSRINDGTVDSC